MDLFCFGKLFHPLQIIETVPSFGIMKSDYHFSKGINIIAKLMKALQALNIMLQYSLLDVAD